MSQKLKDLIRSIRAIKTQAEERAIVQRECAAIRHDFENNSSNATVRGRCMLKLMYITMLGYPTEFGQMEVVKLLAEKDFACKRIGYLALAIVLDETTEVLTLAENHMKNDLGDQNPFVQALALDTVANVAGSDMARDCVSEVMKLIGSSNVQLHKKSHLAARRIVIKAPETAELFFEKVMGLGLFTCRNHGIVITGISLVLECLKAMRGTEEGARALQKCREQISNGVRVLKALVLASFATEHDVQAVADPFLQVKVLQFMRYVGKGSAVASEAMNDILAQVITNTEGTKNVHCAILYECVRTIAAVESDDGLRVLGVNILGRFVVSKDNNSRFVALGSLLQWLEREPVAVQRHRMTIIDCLKDVDISIRRKALRLTVALIDESNVRALTPDLLGYLAVCADEIKAEATAKVASVIENHAPNPDWRIEMSARLFKTGKNLVPESFATNFIAMVTQLDPSAQKQHATQLLWEEMSQPFDGSMQGRTALLIAGQWLVGEYVDLFDSKDMQLIETMASTIATITTETGTSSVKLYGLTALAKIASKFPQVIIIAQSVFETLAGSLDCEIQQRACEYMALIETFPDLAKFGLERMPPLVVEPPPETITEVPIVAAAAEHKDPTATDLVPPRTLPTGTQHSATQNKNIMDSLFDDAPPAPKTMSQGSASGSVDDLFGPSPTTSTPPAHLPPPPAKPAGVNFEVFRCDDCVVDLTASPKTPNDYTNLSILAKVTSHNGKRLTDVSLLVAVPRSCTVSVKPISSSVVDPGQSVTQELSVDATNDPSQGKLVMLKVKLLVTSNGTANTHLFQVAKEL